MYCLFAGAGGGDAYAVVVATIGIDIGIAIAYVSNSAASCLIKGVLMERCARDECLILTSP